MAGMFYSLQEAAEKLNKTEEQLKEIVQEGRLREFRDGPNLLFKIEEIEALMTEAEAAEPEAPAIEVTEPEIPEPEMPASEAEEEEAVELDLAEPEEDISELQDLSEEEVPSLSALEAELEVPEPEAPKPSESAADSDEILLAPETGAPLMSNDLTDADTALTGLGTSVLGETDKDYAITDDTMAETAIPTGAGGTTPEVPLEEVRDCWTFRCRPMTLP